MVVIDVRGGERWASIFALAPDAARQVLGESSPMFPADKSPVPVLGNATRRDIVAKWFGIAGCGSCGLLILLMIVAAGHYCFVAPHDVGTAMGFGLFVGILLSVASIPVFLLCLAGGILSAMALRRQKTAEARLGILLSCWAPAAMLMCYAIEFAIALSVY